MSPKKAEATALAASLNGVHKESDHANSPNNKTSINPAERFKHAKAQQRRLRKNLRKVVLALLLEAKFARRDTGILSKKLEMRLKEEADELKRDDLVLGDETIKRRLDDAIALWQGQSDDEHREEDEDRSSHTITE
jgi:hypothetical protein